MQNIEWRTHRSTEWKSYLGLDVIERRRADDGKADQEDISLGVGQRSESIVILLTSSIPQTQANRSTIHHNTRSVVIKAGYRSTGGFPFRERRQGNREITGERARTRLGCTPQGRRWSYRRLGDMSIESQAHQFKSSPPAERDREILTLPTAPSPVTTHCIKCTISHVSLDQPKMTHGTQGELTFSD